MAAKPGEVWLADLGLAAKTRPVVILSRDDPQALARLWSMFPYHTKSRQPLRNRTGQSEVLERNVCCECSRYWFHPGQCYDRNLFLGPWIRL